MREIPAYGIEARRWTVVFHRKSEHLLFRLLAMGRFKHVSAFAWIPELGIWTIYDVGFRRTQLIHLADGQHAHAVIAALAVGNVLVTVDTRNDSLPLMRLGMFCTTSVAHLIGLQSGALRPDKFFRDCLRSGGILHPGDDQWQPLQTIFRKTFSGFCSTMIRMRGICSGKYRSDSQSPETERASI